MFEALKLDNGFFVNFFSPTKWALLLFQIGKKLTLMIKRAKGFELMKIVFITHLNTCGNSKVFSTLKIIDFGNMALTKVVHLCDRGHECIIYII
jgi:hypothetical protein